MKWLNKWQSTVRQLNFLFNKRRALFNKKLDKKIHEKFAEGIATLIGIVAIRMMLIAGAQVQVSPTAPPAAANSLTTILGYMQWLGIVGGVGVGALLAGIKIALQHDMEGGKRDLMYSVIGGVVISIISAVLNQFV
jgi:hypothetical protein